MLARSSWPAVAASGIKAAIKTALNRQPNIPRGPKLTRRRMSPRLEPSIQQTAKVATGTAAPDIVLVRDPPAAWNQPRLRHLSLEADKGDGKNPYRHFGMALRFVARAFLSEGTAAQRAVAPLRQPILDHRTQWRVLSDTDDASRTRLARADERRLCLCLEGIEVHHALEAAVAELGKQPRTVGKPPVAARRKGGTHPVSIAAAVSGQSGKTRVVLQIAVQETPLQLRIS